MKVMDGAMETEDCAVTTVVPPKKKKLRQAQLPFQTLGSSATPTTTTNKKRKLATPSPNGCRSSKVLKFTAKEISETKFHKVEDTYHGKTKDSVKGTDENSSDKSGENSSTEDHPPSQDPKIDRKSQPNFGAISRFFRKITTNDDKKDVSAAEPSHLPIVRLTRCDESDVESVESDKLSCTNSHKINAEEKSQDSGNEELAKELENSDDDDAASKEKTDVSSEIRDSDSERGISSSDDEIDETKKSTDLNNERKSTSGKETPTSGVKADGTSSAHRRLTPKQLEKKRESMKRREERTKERIEKEKKREEERLIRRKEQEAKRQEKKEKEEAEKEQKRKEKEQKELKKQAEIEQKQKEKERRDKAKEEDRRKREEAKEEEKRKKEKETQEAERRKQKAASTFVSFFVPKKQGLKIVDEKKVVRSSNFMPFQIKADMRVAPICRRNLNDAEKLTFDKVCVDRADDTDILYVKEIKKDHTKIRKSGKTWPPESKDDVVIIEEDDVGSCNMVDQSNSVIERQRAKLFAFAENRRPPYWGTWSKRSTVITPRRPFIKDMKWFDYEVDSDEEWEEEEPGESLRGSDDEKDEENPDDNEYDVDNEFMVPHGYLSDEEAQADEDEEDMSPETQKFKLKILGEEFEAERKEQTSKIKPKVIGCIWQGPLNSYPENTRQKLVDFLMARQAWVREIPIMIATKAEVESAKASENPGAPQALSTHGEEKRGAKKKKLPEEALPELIRLIHGNVHGSAFLVKEFMTFWNRNHGSENPLSKSSVASKIREFARRMACPEEGPMHLKACWYVSEETRNTYLGKEQLTIPNCWSYALEPKRKTLTEASETIEKPEKEEKDKDRKNVPLITQYTKKITQEEMKKQLEVKPIQSPKVLSSQGKIAKRATLISVGRGEQFPKSPIISAFSKASTTVTSKPVQPVIIDLDSEDSLDTNIKINDTTQK